MPLSRSTPLRRSTPLPKGKGPSRGTRLQKANPERQKRKRAQYAKGLAAYRRSETYQIVEARGQGQCEFDEQGPRCEVREKLGHHHKTYQRFGGRELPEDMALLCEGHHALVEMRDHPHRRHGRVA